MTVAGYLTEHWGLLILLIGLSTIIFADNHLDRGILRRIAYLIGMIFVYSVSCYAETYLGNQTEYSVFRPFLSAVNYSLIIFIVVHVILIMYPKHSVYFWVPASLNCLLCFLSLKTRIVFYITGDNHFKRGILGYLTYVICVIYLVYFIKKIFDNAKNRAEDFTLPAFMLLTSILCLLMPLLLENLALHWFIFTIAIDILFYYIYILQQYTKRDALTNLLNRQSYYIDAEKYMSSITAYVALDMNGLKAVNDQEGHLAGDLALKSLADCIWTASRRNHRVYRIGGDEFAILCLDTTEEKVKEFIQQIRDALAQTPYTCSIGYAMKNDDNSLDTLYQRADANLYEEKGNYYKSIGHGRHGR